jgi:hypothetical protein
MLPSSKDTAVTADDELLKYYLGQILLFCNELCDRTRGLDWYMDLSDS